jgi:hypothetical protein
MIKRIVVLLKILFKMNDSLCMLRCSNRSYLVRYTIILITSRDCNHITWFRNSASVSLLATLSHKTWMRTIFHHFNFFKSDQKFRLHFLKNFLQTKIFFLFIFDTRNRHSTMIENYIRRDDVIKCELDLTFIERIDSLFNFHRSLSRKDW